jgi:hypothetical protein
MALSREGCAQYESLPHDKWGIATTSLHPAPDLSENACQWPIFGARSSSPILR